MANFDKSGMTQAGINLMGKAVGGATIQFTKLVLGDGTMTGEILDLQGVVSPKQNVDVTRIERNDNQCTVGGELLTSSVKQGFFWRECGLYAMDPDVGEILYNYAYSTKPDYIASSDSGMMEEILVSMIALVGANANVDITIDDSMVFATKKKFEEKTSGYISINEFPALLVEEDDTGRIQRALDYAATRDIPMTILLDSGATYNVSSTLSFEKSYTTLTTSGEGKAVIKSSAIDIALKIDHCQRCTLSNIRIDASKAETILFIGNGDTWYSNISNVELNGSEATTKHGVLYTNHGTEQYRDYFTTFYRVNIRYAKIAFAIGGKLNDDGTFTNALQEVNRIKLIACDVYGHSLYGVYFGNGNGHVIQAMHYTNANKETVKADLGISNPYHHSVDMFCESGSPYQIHFINGNAASGIYSVHGIKTPKYLYGESSTVPKEHRPIDGSSSTFGTHMYYSETGDVISTKAVQIKRIEGYENQDVVVNLMNGSFSITEGGDYSSGASQILELQPNGILTTKKKWAVDLLNKTTPNDTIPAGTFYYPVLNTPSIAPSHSCYKTEANGGTSIITPARDGGSYVFVFKCVFNNLQEGDVIELSLYSTGWGYPIAEKTIVIPKAMERFTDTLVGMIADNNIDNALSIQPRIKSAKGATIVYSTGTRFSGSRLI